MSQESIHSFPYPPPPHPFLPATSIASSMDSLLPPTPLSPYPTELFTAAARPDQTLSLPSRNTAFLWNPLMALRAKSKPLKFACKVLPNLAFVSVPTHLVPLSPSIYYTFTGKLFQTLTYASSFPPQVSIIGFIFSFSWIVLHLVLCSADPFCLSDLNLSIKSMEKTPMITVVGLVVSPKRICWSLNLKYLPWMWPYLEIRPLQTQSS